MNIIEGDIHEEIIKLETNSVDLIYTNPPYNTTENKWDKKLDWKLLFKEMWRVLKPNGKIILHSSIPFTYDLIQVEKPKYHYIWIKEHPTNFFHAKKQPLRQEEEILVYYKKQGTYNPQMIGEKFYKKTKCGKSNYYGSRGENKIYETEEEGHYGKYPNNILNYARHIRGFSTRPNELVDYFIKTYSNEEETILDITCYNYLTGYRAKKLNRNYIGIDLNPVEMELD
jgi:site-specific DNA-methyltransferase (adenine-specific)|tara:strand:+ start:483 stop:1163 length:681 start_codon:yes stop_codon:yes gene_type:complete